MISVKDLIGVNHVDKYSTTSRVYGRIHIVSNTSNKSVIDHHQRGTVLLFDHFAAHTYIVCQVDRFYHGIQDTLISIPQWKLVTLDLGTLYLQFAIDSVLRLGYGTNTLGEEQMLAAHVSYNLLQGDNQQQQWTCYQPHDFRYITPDRLQYQPQHKRPVTVAGKVSAKSVLYIKPGSEACFFVELRNIDKTYADLSSSPNLTYKAAKSLNGYWTVPIICKGDQWIQFYKEIQIGRYYLFNNIQPTSMMLSSISLSRQRRQISKAVFHYRVLQSSFLTLTKQQCQHLVSAYASNDNIPASVPFKLIPTSSSSSTSPPSLSSSSSQLSSLANFDTNPYKLRTYTGTVTRIVDALFGVYELDHQLLICLFHYIGYSETCPYDVGTCLKVSHAHFLTLSSVAGTSSVLLDSDWKAPTATVDEEYTSTSERRYVLVACMRSDVQIIQFSNDVTAIEQNEQSAVSTNVSSPTTASFASALQRMIYAHCIGRHLNFNALIRQLELFSSLQIKFSALQQEDVDDGQTCSLLSVGQQLIETVFAATGNRSVHSQGDMYGDFFQHGPSCIAVSEATQASGKVVMDSCPTLQELFATILACNVNDTTTDGPGPYKMKHMPLVEVRPTFITEHPEIIRYGYDTSAKDTAWVIGLVDCLPDGQVYFMDDTYRIKLFVGIESMASTSYVGKHHGLLPGYLYIVKRFQLVVEKMTFSDTAITLEQMYMMCNYADLTPLSPIQDSKGSKHVILMPDLICGNNPDTLKNLTHFEATDNNSDIEVDISLHQVVDMLPITLTTNENDTIQLERWVRTVCYETTGNQSTKPPIAMMLVFTSQLDSLSYTSSLRIGSWFGLTPISGSEEWKGSEGPTPCFVDHTKHQYYPVTHRHHHLATHQPVLALAPILTSPGQVPLQSQIDLYDLPAIQHIAEAISAPSPSPSIPTSSAINIPQQQQQQRQRQNKSKKQKTGSTKGTTKPDKLVNIHGIILFKGFLNEERNMGDDDATEIELFRRLGIGYGRRYLKLFVQIRQVDSLETADVYMGGDLYHQSFVYGLIPGNAVTLYHVDRKQSSGSKKVYFVTNSYTVVEVYPQLSRTLLEDLVSFTTKNLPTRSLQSLILDQKPSDALLDESGAENKVFKVMVTVRRVFKVELQWVCTECGTEIYQGKCYNDCTEDQQRRLFRASARVEISDGTAECTALVDGEGLVFRLLMLLPAQQDALKYTALKHGTLVAGTWVGAMMRTDEAFSDDMQKQHRDVSTFALRNGMTLEDLCTRLRRYGHFLLYGKRCFPFNDQISPSNSTRITASTTPTIDKLRLRQMDIFGQKTPVTTLMLPLLKVKVEALERVDPMQQAWQLIDQLSSLS